MIKGAFSWFFFAVLLLAGCNNDGIKLFDADVKLSRSFDVEVPENAPIHSLTFSRIVDASTEPDMQAYIDRLDSYRVNGVTYSITNYSGETTILTEGTVSIESIGGNELGSVTLTNINLEELNDAGEQVLPFTDTELSSMATALKADNKLNITISADIDNDPVQFTLTTYLDLTIEYRVFD